MSTLFNSFVANSRDRDERQDWFFLPQDSVEFAQKPFYWRFMRQLADAFAPQGHVTFWWDPESFPVDVPRSHPNVTQYLWGNNCDP